MDSTAANNAGMSYGKWKILHPHTEDENGQMVKRCRICGAILPSKRGCHGGHNIAFCSYECSMEGKRIRERRHAQKKRDQMNKEPQTGDLDGK